MGKKVAPGKRKLSPFKATIVDRGVPYTTGRDHALRGDLPYFKFGRAWYVDPADVDRWIERQRQKGDGSIAG
jgi:hypothetical protein